MVSWRHWKHFAIVVTLLIGTLAIGSAASAKSSGASDAKSSFTFVATIVGSADIERGFTFLDSMETTDGVPIDGWDGGRCINLGTDEADLTQWMCELVIHLPEGNIVAAGPVDLTSPTFVFAVTGGTGDFRNARGELEVVPIDELSSFGHVRLTGGSAKY